MRLVLVHARAGLLELLRMPAYVVPTVGFPTMFFLFFAAPQARGDAATLMALFAGFAVLGVAFFQFGVGIAVERASPWERFVRTLAVSPGQRFAGRILAALAFAVASAGILIAVAVATTAAQLSLLRWVGLAAVLLLGVIPFSLLGIALGYLVPPRAALPVANVAYLALSYLGGLWTRPEDLPDGVKSISHLLPTGALAESLVGTTSGDGAAWGALGLLGIYSMAFAALARWAYRRDEGEHFR